ncbi:uncharacterized protein [Palaemon carinicauda]|uniref:uncharacterized protein n=1 Tax=Palaemon carinicauda TaxID=392227 RepID=UPI0035B5F135
MSANASCLRDCLLDDGRFVLQKVVDKLYRGGNQRPDVFFKSNPKLRQKNYDGIFTYEQRQTIKGSGSCAGYDIESASELFDVSLLVLLAEHTCGLSQSDPLLKKVFELRNKRNKACHNGNQLMTNAVLCDELDNLLDLYTDILDKLEERSYSDLSYDKMEIKRRIQKRNPMVQYDYRSSTASPNFHSEPEEDFDTSLCVERLRSYTSNNHDTLPTWSASHHNTRTTTRSNSNIPTWGKVALGLTAGIATLGLVGAAVAEAATEDKQSRQKKRKDKEEECGIM